MFSLITSLSLVVVVLAHPDNSEERLTDGSLFTTSLSGPCVQYKCVHGDVVVEKADCLVNGMCFPEDSMIIVTCKPYRCGQSPEGLIGFLPVPGSEVQCRDKDGQCGYDDGDAVRLEIAAVLFDCTCAVDKQFGRISYVACKAVV